MYGNVYYYYITNLQGDVLSIVDGAGNVVASYEYDPYGNVIESAGILAEINPLRYRGYVYDPETETDLYYLWSRYYDPAVGRYLNHDVVFDYDVGLQGYNLFAYCGNTPIFRLDPYGTNSVGVEEDADITNDTVTEKDGGGLGGAHSGTGGVNWDLLKSTLNSASTGLNMATGAHVGYQNHHMLSNKNKTYTPYYKEVTDRYNLELEQDWNTVYLNNHRGRHTTAYHEYMLTTLHCVDSIAQGDPELFKYGFAIVADHLNYNPGIMYAR